MSTLKKKSKTNKLTLHLKELKKRQKIRGKNKINETGSWFFEKITHLKNL